MDRKRRDLIPYLAPWKKAGAYLAGGTALALQLGHRTSNDFDYYIGENFIASDMAELLALPSGKFRVTDESEGSLFGIAKEVKISLFRYPYPLLKPVVELGPLALASMEDIAAMKMIAIVQRGRRRDFIDLYFLIRRFSLRTVLELTREKYPMFDPYNGLKGLVYFNDAENEKPREGVRLLERVSWDDVKGFLLRQSDAMIKKLR